VLVNNAGIPKRRDVTRLSVDDVEATMRINYFSPVRLIRALLPGLIDRSGRIVNISSVAARLGPPIESAYAATKAAITAFSESMAVDLRDTGVKVHVVNPGVLDTELFHLPDNEQGFHTQVEMLPVDAIVEPVLAQLDAGTFEAYVPDWFKDVVAGKFADTDAFLAGTTDFARQQTGASTSGS
jgi:short-subunit dehydrogenase